MPEPTRLQRDRLLFGRDGMSAEAQLRMDCEEAFTTISDGIDTLRIIWDQAANGASDYGPRMERALNFTLGPMEDAIRRLGQRLGLE